MPLHQLRGSTTNKYRPPSMDMTTKEDKEKREYSAYVT